MMRMIKELESNLTRNGMNDISGKHVDYGQCRVDKPTRS
jgi:hypothetical protein